MSFRYQRIYTKIWWNEKVRGLSPEGQRFFLYLMANESTNLVGIYHLKEGYVRDDLQCTSEEFCRWLNEVLSARLATRDEGTGELLVHGQLKHTPITNKNQLKAALKIINSVKSSRILNVFNNIVSTSEVLAKGLHKGLQEGLRNKGVGVGVGVDNHSIGSSFNKDNHSTSYSPLSTAAVSKKEEQGAEFGGDTEREWDEGLRSDLAKIHFELFSRTMKGEEWAKLEPFSPEQVLAKYREALGRQGSGDEVRRFVWILNGLEGRNGETGKGRGLLGKIFGAGDKEEKQRRFRYDVG